VIGSHSGEEETGVEKLSKRRRKHAERVGKGDFGVCCHSFPHHLIHLLSVNKTQQHRKSKNRKKQEKKNPRSHQVVFSRVSHTNFRMIA
jgi:hypothetical protein